MASLESGCSITTTMLAKDTSHKTVFPVFTAGGGFGMREMEGAADVLMVADPTTFRVLPWAPTTGWLLCDLYFSDGRPVPFATRHLYRKVLDQLGQPRLRFRRGARGRISPLQARRRAYGAGRCRPARTSAVRQPAVARLSIPDRAALRPDGAGAGNYPPRRAGARPALALGRGRVRPEPVRIHLCADQGTGRPPTTWCCSVSRKTDRAPPRLSRHLHVPAETAQRVRLRLAPASIDGVARERRRTPSWRRTAGKR